VRSTSPVAEAAPRRRRKVVKSLQIASVDDVIEMWLQRSHLLIDSHSSATRCYRVIHYILGMLIIVLSGIKTSPCTETLIPYLSSLVVIVASIYVFLGFNDTAERHRRAARTYGEIMRGLEGQKGAIVQDVTALRMIEEKINRANSEAPDVPLWIFNRMDTAMRTYVGQIEQERRRSIPRLVSNVHFKSYGTVQSGELTQEHYRMETDHFGKYASCPSTFAEFHKKREGKSLVLTDARMDGNLIGYCLFERIEDGLCHLTIAVVSPAYRRQGIGRALISTACEHLTTQGVTRVSLFTADAPRIGRLFRGVADPVSVESELTSDEVAVLSRIARHRGLSESEYGRERVVRQYYMLRDGSTLNATFKLYRL